MPPREEAVVGETPNLAARLQTLAQPNAVLIGPATRRLIGGAFELEELGPQALKGFADPVPVWRVIGTRSVESRFEARTIGLTPMVGREQEVALLLDRWQQAKDGEGQAVLLSGEPGIGKSRIVRAVCEQVEARTASCGCATSARPTTPAPPSIPSSSSSSAPRASRATTPTRPSWTSWKPCWRRARSA